MALMNRLMPDIISNNLFGRINVSYSSNCFIKATSRHAETQVPARRGEPSSHTASLAQATRASLYGSRTPITSEYQQFDVVVCSICELNAESTKRPYSSYRDLIPATHTIPVKRL